MCGYVFVSYRDKKTKKISHNMMRHRGPDYSGEIDLGWCRARHWRLTIQDLTEHSHQPFTDQEDYLIYNGEFYDFRELAKKLFSKSFQSDTQLLFYALKHNEFDLLKKESGFYSFVFIVQSSKTLFAARDFFGKKPLYYFFDEDLLVIASEDSTIRKIVLEYGKNVAIDPSSIAHYFEYKDLHFGKTYFKGINELAPGSSLSFDFGNWKLSENISWYEYYYSKPFYESESISRKNNQPMISTQELKENLVSSIEKRFSADVPVQLALSGGIDSTLLALLAKNHKNFDRALTISSGSRPTELIKSRLLCKKFGIDQFVIDFDDIDVMKCLKDAIKAQASPLSHPHALAIYTITKEASKRGKVLITGEGADELMYGYEHYKKDKITFAFKKHLNLDDCFKGVNLHMICESNSSMMVNFLDNNSYRDLEVKTHLLSLLRRNDRNSMQNSVELRAAYLDFHLFEYMTNQQKIGVLKKGKESIVEVIKDLYLDYEVDSEKIGFYVPFDDWYSSNADVEEVDFYIRKALSFFENELNLDFLDDASIEKKLAWSLLNIGVFLELEGYDV